MWKTLLSTVLLASIPSAQADVNAFKACIMAKVEPLRSACPTQECTPSCKAAAGRVIDSLDGSCCSNVDEATDGLSPETCKAMMSSQVVPKIKQAVEQSCGAPDLSETLSMFDAFKKQEKITPVTIILPDVAESAPPTKSKMTLALLWVTLIPSFLGVDRCFLGGPMWWLGLVKGFTLGGLVIWGVVDYVALFLNFVHKAPSSDELMLKLTFPAVSFPQEQVDKVFYIGAIGLATHIIVLGYVHGMLAGWWMIGGGLAREKGNKVENDPEESAPALYHQLSA